MKFFLYSILTISLVTSILASPLNDKAQALTSEYDRNIAILTMKIKEATTDEVRKELFAKVPDAKAYGDALIKLINGRFKEDWTVPHMAWLIRNHPKLQIQKKQVDGSLQMLDREYLFMQYVERFHLESFHAGVFAISMTFSDNPNTNVQQLKRSLADQIFAKHANKNHKVMGAAALALGHFTPAIEGDKKLIKSVLAYYRTAVLHAADVKVGNVTVGKLVDDKLYIINNLSKGSPVPLIEGFDALGRKHELAERKGKLVLLCFWNEKMEEFELFIEQLNKMKRSGDGKNFELIGISSDSVSAVRTHIGEGKITWRNFMDVNGSIAESFKVKTLPYCYIISPKGSILYRGGFGGPLFGSIIASHLTESK